MSETKGNKPDLNNIRLPVKKDIVPCVLCSKPHERRPGPVHRTAPVCQVCDDRMNRASNGVRDTVDFKIKGF